MIDDVLKDASRRMDKTVEATRHEFTSVRTGRASGAPRPRARGSRRPNAGSSPARRSRRRRSARGEAMIDYVLKDASRRMDKTVEATRHEFTSVRTGRASGALLDRVQVSAYGTKM